MTIRERLWVQRWKEAHVFEPSFPTDKHKFYFTVPYAYPTGPLHVGHGRTYLNGDALARFQRVKGKEVFWPMGFHVTGTPVLAISDAISRKDAKTIELYHSYVGLYENDPSRIDAIVQSFTQPLAVANYFGSKVSEDLDLLGCSIDWRSRFTTMDPEYQRFVQWQFSKLKEKGVLVKGNYPILYSPLDQNAVGEDDIKDGDTDKVSIQEFYWLPFKIVGENTSIVVATLRPETIYGATHVWVHPQEEYVRARVNGAEWIISKEAVEKLRLQNHVVETIAPVPSAQLLQKEVLHPLDDQMRMPILPATFVSGTRGTGMVFAVPGHAPWDFVALQELKQKGHPRAGNIEVKTIVDLPGFDGMDAFLVSHQALSLEKTKNIQAATEELYKREFYEGTLNQFNGAWSGLPVKEAKDKMVAFLQEKGMGGILYEPSRPAETRAGKQVQVAILPDQWFIDYSGKQWKETTKRHVEQMTIFPPRFRRNIMDAIDWLDHRPCIRKRGLGTPFPFDNPKEEWMIEPLSDSTIYMLFYLAIPLIRESGLNIDDLDDVFWDAALLGKELNSSDKRCKTAQTIHEQITFWYPNDQRHTAPAHISNHISFFLLTHTLLFDESYWPKACTFNEMLVRNGVKMSKSKGNVIPLQQAIRDHGADLVRLYMASSAGFERVVDWKDTQVPQVKKKLQEIEGVLEAAASQKEETLSPAQEWLAETLKQRLGEAYAAYDDMEMMLAAQKIFFETLNDIKRFKKVFGEKETPAVKRVLKEWLVLLTPITPFLGEELWAKSGWKGFASLQALQKPIGNPSPHMDDHMNFIEKVLGDIERVKKLVKGKQVTTLYLYSPDATETRWLNEAQEALRRHTTLIVKINDSHDPLGKMQKAQKGRPALYLE